MPYHADISENELLKHCPDVLNTLLRDRTTGENIFWATDSYARLGEGYRFGDPITADHITGDRGMVIQPRVLKRKEEQAERTKDKAEVFTPSWVCNEQNNLIDEAWFGRKGVFNTADEGLRTWTTNRDKAPFTKERSWKAYVCDTRLEITCGEAPYLVSRYDTTTGDEIALEERIGILDRKLRVVGENTESRGEWLQWAAEAYKHTYGYEWQGDSLLLAREALLATFVEYYQAKFGEHPSGESLLAVADIISWNLWQMDGLKGVVPCSCRDMKLTLYDLDGTTESVVRCQGCRSGNIKEHNGTYCRIMDWDAEPPKEIRFIDLMK